MEYILYCDESSEKGSKYSDFFGGCIVSSKDYHEVSTALELTKKRLNLNGEVKWTKLTENYLDKYIELMTEFFGFIKSGKVKVRIMFRRNDDVPSDMAIRAADDKYFKLYYQFIKHAFGLKYIRSKNEPVYIRIYLDQLPDKKEKCAKFKRYLMDIPEINDFAESCIIIREGDVAEVRSHDHVILQCLDVVLGSMYFRLNHLHKAIPSGESKRGKRTVAKETLYKHIHWHISEIFPNFNIGESTGTRGYSYPNHKWEQPYRHWKFVPKK